MSHAARRPLLTAAVAATSLALCTVPGAEAAKPKPKVSKAEKAQNTAIKKAQKTATGAGKSAKTAGKDAKKALKDAATGLANAKTADGKAAAAQNGLNVLFSQVPAVLDGLTKLASGLTAAGDGLTKLGSAVAAQEYGVVKVQVGGVDAPGAILTSSDIPDDSNAATVSGTLVVPIPGNTTNAPVTLLAGVRSGEADGNGPADPVASAGLVSMTMTGAAATGVSVSGGNPGLSDVPLTSKANDASGGAPVYPIPFKAPRVDGTPNPFAFPTDKAIELTDPATLQPFAAPATRFTVTNIAPSQGVATVTFTVRFNDLTASATDVTA
jgi:hypothetical protein